MARGHAVWKCIVGNSKRWKEGKITCRIESSGLVISATRLSADGNTSVIRFDWDPQDETFAQVIEAAGVIPIPPYLNRDTEAIDDTRYQTVYSLHKGSVAAPTAGWGLRLRPQ